MITTPKFEIQTLELSPLGSSIWIDNHKLWKRKYFHSLFFFKHYSKIMIISTCIGSIVRLYIIAHKKSTEMAPHFTEGQLLHILLLYLKQVSVYLWVYWPNFFQFSYF